MHTSGFRGNPVFQSTGKLEYEEEFRGAPTIGRNQASCDTDFQMGYLGSVIVRDAE